MRETLTAYLDPTKKEVPVCEQPVQGVSRRGFLSGLALTGMVRFLRLPPRPVAAEPPPETTKISLIKISGICIAPQYVAEELLRGEGFTEVQYVEAVAGAGVAKALASGEAHISLSFSAPCIIQVDAWDPIVMLAGVHVGCFELFGSDWVHTIRDLQGKTVAVQGLGSSQHVFLASMAAYVGLDPRKDITWVTHPSPVAMQLLAEGKIDAFLGFAPDPQELRAKQIGRVVVNSGVDRPWSQYFCCVVASNREFVRKHPVATKRALRAILKATNVCALEPDRVARFLVDRDYYYSSN
jgi:NitT/TauT family transport system substrate-binding protein